MSLSTPARATSLPGRCDVDGGPDAHATARRSASGLKAAEITEEPSRLVVWKFGGTSVGDHDRLRAVAKRLVAAQQQGCQLASPSPAHSRP